MRAWQAVGWVALAVGLAPVGSASAVDKPKPTPGAEAKPPEPVSSDPQQTTATFGDWVERCQRLTVGGEARRVCEVAATVTANGQTSPLAEVAIGRLKKADPLRVTLVLPVNVGFPSAPKIALGDEGDAMELAWRQCVPAGCFAETTLNPEREHAFRDAKSAKVESRSAAGQGFNFAISLRGLPQALDAMAREP